MKNVQAILLFLIVSGISTLATADGVLGGLLGEGFPSAPEPLALLLTGLAGIMLGTWNRK